MAGLVLATGLVAAGCSSRSTAPPGTTGSPSATSVTTTSNVPVSAVATTTSAPPLPAGQQGPVTAVPWSQVGTGWLLALWGPDGGSGAGPLPAGSTPRTQETTMLFLVDPLGGRYLITTLAPPATSNISGWSGDGQRALLTTTDDSQTTVSEIDLRSGSVVHRFALPFAPGTALNAIAFTRPTGQAVLVSSETGSTSTLQRFDMTGAVQQAYPSTFSQVGAFRGGVLSSPDGTQIVMSAAGGLALVDNDGTVAAQLPIAGLSFCAPTRWWSSGVALASCLTKAGTQQLVEVPISGAPVVDLTQPPVAPDLGDLNAWQLGNDVYVQSAGGCGTQYLSKLQASGTTLPVTVPGVDTSDSVFVLGTADGQLALQATVACGSGISAMWFDPAADTTHVVLGPPVNGGGVINAVLYPDPKG